MKDNPEVALPASIEIEIDPSDYPTLQGTSTVTVSSPLKENNCLNNGSWVQAVTKGLETSNSKNMSNDRCNLEH
jgi:hypothetical protein